ncbi:MAG: Gfo/Idh/MocA family oxidoreductase [Anaerolineae bacterium]|nr:Gfo/Idh/MocA family oxidoreductase [Anaerolineae bacterium]
MTIHVGLIGCGLMAKAHLPGYQAAAGRAEIVMCCDNNPQLAQDFSAKLDNKPQVVTDWQEIIANPNIDAVDICAPHFLHAPIVLAAAKAGKHILLEKPMAMNFDEARQMVDATSAAGKIFMVAQNQRYLPEHALIRDWLNKDAIGRVIAARIDGNQFLSRAYPKGHWLFSKALAGGGVIRTTAIHKIDLLRYFLGEVRRVTALYSTSGLNPGMDSEDIATIAMEFENGAIGEAFFTFAAYQNPIPTASHELVILYGTKGMINNINGWHMYSTEVEAYSQAMTSMELPNADYATSFVHEVKHFLDCVETGQEPITSGRDNLNTIAVIDAIYTAAETGQTTLVQRS